MQGWLDFQIRIAALFVLCLLHKFHLFDLIISSIVLLQGLIHLSCLDIGARIEVIGHCLLKTWLAQLSNLELITTNWRGLFWNLWLFECILAFEEARLSFAGGERSLCEVFLLAEVYGLLSEAHGGVQESLAGVGGRAEVALWT